MVEVQEAWPVGGDSRFIFRKNFAKYELFKSPPVSVQGEPGGACPCDPPPTPPRTLPPDPSLDS